MLHSHSLVLKQSLILIMTAGLTLPALANSNNQTCAGRRAAIEKQMDYAKTYGNENELKRLNIARTKIIDHCDDNNLTQKYQKKVEKLQHNILKDQEKLKEAQASGDQQKIDKVQKHLDKNIEKLRRTKENQNHFYQDLSRETQH